MNTNLCFTSVVLHLQLFFLFTFTIGFFAFFYLFFSLINDCFNHVSLFWPVGEGTKGGFLLSLYGNLHIICIQQTIS